MLWQAESLYFSDQDAAREREGVDPKFFYLFSVPSYAVGIDIQLYAMTH